MNRRLIIIPIMLLVVFVGGRQLRQKQQEEDSKRILVSGTVEATDARLGFQVPGRIVALHAREGDRVEKGTELAVLDRRETEDGERFDLFVLGLPRLSDVALTSLTLERAGLRPEIISLTSADSTVR